MFETDEHVVFDVHMTSIQVQASDYCILHVLPHYVSIMLSSCETCAIQCIKLGDSLFHAALNRTGKRLTVCCALLDSWKCQSIQATTHCTPYNPFVLIVGQHGTMDSPRVQCRRPPLISKLQVYGNCELMNMWASSKT